MMRVASSTRKCPSSILHTLNFNYTCTLKVKLLNMVNTCILNPPDDARGQLLVGPVPEQAHQQRVLRQPQAGHHIVLGQRQGEQCNKLLLSSWVRSQATAGQGGVGSCQNLEAGKGEF